MHCEQAMHSFSYYTLYIRLLPPHVSRATQYRKTVATPTFGGTFNEGIIGTPRFVNPVLAVTRADKDLTALVYDGLLRLGEDGVLIPSIAESITVSEDGLTYNVIMKQHIHFHDGSPLTAHDVAFTVEKYRTRFSTVRFVQILKVSRLKKLVSMN